MIYYKELSHAVIEAEKSQNVQSVSQRPGRDSGERSSPKPGSSKFKKTQCFHLSLKAGQLVSQLKAGRRGVLSYSASFFY